MPKSPLPDTDPWPELRRLRDELVELRRELAACRAREIAALVTAQVDPLTGLLNRRVFDDRIGRQIALHTARRGLMALLFVDLDDFKAVNDEYGHAVGDALLRLVGLRLRHAMRQQDLVCRVGGDEFACVLFDLRGEHEMHSIEHKLQDLVGQPCHVGGLSLRVRPSIGAALFPRDGRNPAALLAHADRSMYQAKRGHLALVRTAVRSEGSCSA